MADEDHDPQTLAFYDREATAYAGRRLAKASRLTRFLAALPVGASVLDLGCGGGQDSEVMLAEGFAVTPLDGSAGLPRVLARVRRALKPDGVFHASYKAGDGGGRDTLGRYFNFPSEAELRAAYGEAEPWAELEIRQGVGHSYEQEERTWLHVAVVRPA